MEAEYRCAHDGLQWVLYREADCAVAGKDRKPTGEVKRKESVVGYFPYLSQALTRMYEGMVADGVGVFQQDEILMVLNESSTALERIKCMCANVGKNREVK